MRFRRDTPVRKHPVCRKGHAVGLDIGAGSVRASVLGLTSADGRPSATMSGGGTEPLPAGAVVNGVVMDQVAVTRALKKLWAGNGLHCRSVVLGMANPQIVVRPLEIPNLTAAQRAKALPFQAREVIALPMDEVILDYVQLGDPDPGTGMVSGLLIAAPRRPVLAAVDAVERAGLTVARVDLSSFGALRAIADGQLSVQAVIDVGAHLTSIVIHNRGVPQLVRTLARGGQQLTDVLADTLEIDPQEAERRKCERGLTDRGDAVSDALTAAIRPLLAEVRSSINYFRAGSGGAQLEGISLTGGGAALPGLAAALSTQNGVPTAVVTPLHQLVGLPAEAVPMALVTGDRASAASAVSIGLALGAA